MPVTAGDSFLPMSGAAAHPTPLDLHSPPSEKIACFQSLFRGRTDVYPLRFESRRTGRAGYSPACGNEWVKGICGKPRIKCSDCPHRNWLAVNERTIEQHLSGRGAGGGPFVMGVYPMLLDETCFFLAIDLDGEGWPEDARALRSVIRDRALPVALERSRSGDGAHFWFFFEEAVPAAAARSLGAHLLTEAMEARPEIGLASYDRMFPNQDTLPRGGFGNLIALPLQKEARMAGNSVFLDEALEPYPDQWAFLGNLRKIPRREVAARIARAGSENRVLPVRIAPEEEFALAPWEARPSRRPAEAPLEGELPERVSVVHADRIHLPKADLPPGLRNRVLLLAAFQNPEFHRAQAMRLPTYDKPRVIACAEDHPGHIALPRGCLDDLRKLFRRNRIGLRIEDRRENGRPLDVRFTGALRPGQSEAAGILLRHDTGVLAATTAFGKTVLAAWMIAERGVNTLILVHRRQLMDQWFERLGEFLDFPAKAIGRLGAGRRTMKGRIDIALIQSLVRGDSVEDRIAGYGHVIVDECHHVSARGFELALRRARAKYILGLTATVRRKDGRHPIIFMQCGPVRHRVEAKAEAGNRPFGHSVLVRPTAFRPCGEPEEDARLAFQSLCRELVHDSRRNAAICGDVREAFESGRHPLVLTERTEHLDRLAEGFAEAGLPHVVLRGGMGTKELAAAMETLSPGSPRPPIVLATGRFVGEGFDCPRLDTLFLTLPVSWRGTIAQYAGRLHRLHEGKKEVRIHDYADLEVPMLSRMFDKRCEGYQAVGYTVLLPASALPGWPRSVPLPVDPLWKRDYAASVKRLIRDGVDVVLAEMFVRVARPPDAEEKARSASEAFLFRRLESLEATRGKFRLNADLAIPFDQRGAMEVDFLCETARLVVELDGDQHLGDPGAYRRDRRKDSLLQRNGYFVLRVLAGDLGTRLGDVLDEILATLDHRSRRFQASAPP